jgi:predicted nucleotide-binding protein
MTLANNKKVFVVFGKNKSAKREVFAFLRMLNLSPVPWEEAVLFTSRSAAYIGETLNGLLQQAQAVVVLLTGDEEAQLRSEFFIDGDSEDDKGLFPQPRPNVLFEAGMAFSHDTLAPRTILVELGEIRMCHNLEGRHRIQLSNKLKDRWALVHSLEKAGCDLRIPSNELLREVGDFRITPITHKNRRVGTNS